MELTSFDGEQTHLSKRFSVLQSRKPQQNWKQLALDNLGHTNISCGSHGFIAFFGWHCIAGNHSAFFFKHETNTDESRRPLLKVSPPITLTVGNGVAVLEAAGTAVPETAETEATVASAAVDCATVATSVASTIASAVATGTGVAASVTSTRSLVVIMVRCSSATAAAAASTKVAGVGSDKQGGKNDGTGNLEIKTIYE